MLDRGPERDAGNITRFTADKPPSPSRPQFRLRFPKSELGWRTHLLVLLAFSILTFFMTLPLPLELDAKVPGGGDAWQHIWNLWWVKQALLNFQNPYHTGLLYYPDGVSLYLHTLVLTAGVIGIPLQLMGLGLIATYNLILLMSFVLAGYSMFLLCHYLLHSVGFGTRISRAGAFVGGIVFAFAPYHFAHTYGHMNLISIQWMPFYVVLLLKALDAPGRQTVTDDGTSDVKAGSSMPRTPFLYAAGAGVLLAVNAYTDWTYAAFLLMLSALIVLWRILRRSERQAMSDRGVGWLQAGARLLVGLLVFFALAGPVLIRTLAEANLGYAQQDPHETLVYSSDAILAFMPSELHPIWGSVVKSYIGQLGPYLPIKNPSERTLSLGYTVLALALLGGFFFRRVGQLRFWLFAAVATWVLSLGPILQLNGETIFTDFKLSYPLPYLALFDLPFFSIMRSPSRLTVLTMLALGVVAAYVVAQLLRRLNLPSAATSRSGAWRIAGGVLVGVVVPALILFEFMASLDLVEPGWDVPIYSKIAAEPGRFALLELPLRPFGDYMLYQTVHGKPIIGGYLSRQPPYPTRDNTPVLRYLLPTTDAADSVRDAVTAGKGVQTLTDLKVKYIIIRWWAFTPAEREAIQAKLAAILGSRPPDFHYVKDQVDAWQLYP